MNLLELFENTDLQRIKFRGTDHDIGEERYVFVIDGNPEVFNFSSDEDDPDPSSPSFEEILARVQRSGAVAHHRITPAEQQAMAKKIAAERQRYLDQRQQGVSEAMKPSDIPPSMRQRLTMRDIEAERPQGAFRFRVITPQGDRIDFMDQAAAEQRARATRGRVEPINPQPQGIPDRQRYRVRDPQGSRPAATFTDRKQAERYASAKNLPVEFIPESGKKNARIERILKQLRAKHPQAEDDLEALIFDFRTQQGQDRRDIARLDQENDIEEEDIQRLEKMLDVLRRRNGLVAAGQTE